jgi:GNAT superfamily N-acetyltransferase
LTLFVARLTRDHARESFVSGRDELDVWFRRYAVTNDARYGTAAVWVLCDSDLGDGLMPLGYYTLSTHSVALHDVADLGLTQSRQWPDPIPAILLGRLAIAEAAQGRGLGTRLLRDAAAKAMDVSRQVGAVLFVAEAIDDKALEFYERRGFRRLADDRLVARIKDLEANLR